MSVKVLLVEDEKSVAEELFITSKMKFLNLPMFIIHTEYEFKSC